MLTSATLEVQEVEKAVRRGSRISNWLRPAYNRSENRLMARNRDALLRVMGEAGLRGMYHIAYEDDTAGTQPRVQDVQGCAPSTATQSMRHCCSAHKQGTVRPPPSPLVGELKEMVVITTSSELISQVDKVQDK